jgi:hypothetical protein
VIAKICNGEFSIERIKTLNDQMQKQKQMREKFKQNKKGGNKAFSKDANQSPSNVDVDSPRESSDSNQGTNSIEDKGSRFGRGPKSQKNTAKQPAKNMGSSKSLTVSGKFRKASGGYFRKKLRNQSASEFQS